MDIKLKKLIQALSKDELIELISFLCKNEEISKTIKLIVDPTVRDIDRTLSTFGRWCHSFRNGSRSKLTIENLYNISSMLFYASEKISVKKSAEVSYSIYAECETIMEYCDDDIDVIIDIMCRAKNYLSDILTIHKNDFTADEIRKYSYAVDDE